jgi:signal transduction histidine kinase
LNVVAQSKPIINNIIDNDENFSKHLIKGLQDIEGMSSNREISHLEMISGVNYYIKRISDLPFILIVSLDSKEISNTIIDSIIKKFVEVSVFALMFFLSVISIYRRETWLRAKAEQATIIANKATKAKSDFLAFTAHEIRSPLGFISTGSEIMTKKLFGELPPAYLEYAEGIHQNSKIILDFITDILDENQIIEGKFKIVNSITDLKEIIDKSIAVNKARFNKREVIIEVNIQENLPKLICDQRRILQVMNNLISNAIKYSNDDTKITIIVRIVEDKMQIEVQDQGIGMSEPEIQIALSTYGVVMKKNHNLIESYGLGLPIVKMLLEAHEAILDINSAPNIGTTVKIIFPKFKLIYNR